MKKRNIGILRLTGLFALPLLLGGAGDFQCDPIGYQVFGHVGHVQTADLEDKANWTIVADNMNGFWVGTPTFRSLSLQTRKNIVANANTPDAVVEMPIEMARSNEASLVAAIDAGMNVHSVMIYDENEYQSTLNQSEIQEVKEKYGSQYAILLNIRSFSDDVKARLRQVDGFSFEFQVRTDDAWMDNVAAAIHWGLGSAKVVYLLTPPNHKDHSIYKRYVWDYQTMKQKLKDRLGAATMLNSRLRFVPANYDYTKSGVKVAPEDEILDDGVFNANTQTGAARWLILTR